MFPEHVKLPGVAIEDSKRCQDQVIEVEVEVKEEDGKEERKSRKEKADRKVWGTREMLRRRRLHPFFFKFRYTAHRSFTLTPSS